MKKNISSRILRTAAAVLFILALCLPSLGAALAEDTIKKEFTVSGLPVENATVTVNGTAVTPDAEGRITAYKGDTVRVIPAENYTVTKFTEKAAEGATIILSHSISVIENIYGYQLLVDSDADACDILDKAAETTFTFHFEFAFDDYSAFEYTLPADADPYPDASNTVFLSSESVTVPAGTYDIIVLQREQYSSPYYKWLGGENDNMELKNGMTYLFNAVEYDPSTGYDKVEITESPSGVLGQIEGPDEQGVYSFEMPAENVELSVALARNEPEEPSEEPSEDTPKDIAPDTGVPGHAAVYLLAGLSALAAGFLAMKRRKTG